MTNFFKRNAPTILTFIGAGGVLLTSVLTGMATPKAIKLVQNAEVDKGKKLGKVETVCTAAPAYIPAAIAGLSTIGCIFGANVLNKKSQAALTSAYMLLDSSYKKYREKTNELFGDYTDRVVDGAIAKDELGPNEVSITDETKLFWDVTAGRYFEVTPEKLQYAEHESNKQLITTGYACLNDFYDYLEIPRLDYGDKLGWTTYAYGRYYDGCSNIEFYHHPMALEDGMECTMLYFVTEPDLDYNNY